jgi:hypothetical protein
MKTRFLPTFLILGSALGLSACTTVPSWSFGHEKYRVKGAQYARLGAVGERNNYGGVTDFQPKTTPDLTNVPVLLATEAFKGVASEAELKANLAAAYGQVGGNVNAEMLRQKVENGNYQIFKLAEVDQLVEKLRTQPRILDRLKHKDSRLITAVVVVYDNDEKTILKVNAGGAVSGKITGSPADPSLSVSGSSGSTTEVRVKDGYIIGYEMSAPVWANAQLVDFKVDEIGRGG